MSDTDPPSAPTSVSATVDAASRARAIALALAPAAAAGKRKAEDASASDDDDDGDDDDGDAPRAGTRRKLDDGSAAPPAAAAEDEMVALERKRAALLAAASAPDDAATAPAAAADPPVTVYFSVASALAGTVIGRQGENIQAVQSKTGVRVSIQSQTEAAGAPERVVTITGPAEACATAKSLIMHMIDERGRIPVGSGAIGVPLVAGGGPQVTATVPCPDEKVGAVIGRGGGNIKTIQQKTGAHVSVPKEQDPNNRGTRVVMVSGPTQSAVDMAVAEINSLINGGGDPLPLGMSMPNAYASGSGMTMPIVGGPPGHVSFTMQLNDDRAGALIGRAGSVIRDLQERTGCRVSCPTQKDEAGLRNVLISGPAHNVEMAKAEVMAIAAGSTPSAQQRGGPAGGAYGAPGGYPYPGYYGGQQVPWGGGGAWGGGAYYSGAAPPYGYPGGGQHGVPAYMGAPAAAMYGAGAGGPAVGGAAAGGGPQGGPGGGGAAPGSGAPGAGAAAPAMTAEQAAQWAAYYAQFQQYSQQPQQAGGGQQYQGQGGYTGARK